MTKRFLVVIPDPVGLTILTSAERVQVPAIAGTTPTDLLDGDALRQALRKATS
jgi:hypothetical protein